MLTLANTKSLTIKWKISVGGLIKETQVNIFLVTNLNTRKSQVLEKCMGNVLLSIFLKYL